MTVLPISDTHGLHRDLQLPPADMIIHCGDFSHNAEEARSFIRWYATLPYTYRILVGGNHDMSLERAPFRAIHEFCDSLGVIYLENESIEIEGIKIFGSPFSNQFGGWAFMRPDSGLKPIWDAIPDDTHIVITHGPAYDLGDYVKNKGSVGSVTLRDRLLELPQLTHHFYGHIHLDGCKVHQTEPYVSYNAAVMYEYYELDYGEVKQPQTFIIKDTSCI